jgi:hypothetical protein
MQLPLTDITQSKLDGGRLKTDRQTDTAVWRWYLFLRSERSTAANRARPFFGDTNSSESVPFAGGEET